MMLFSKQNLNISTLSCVPKQLDPRSRDMGTPACGGVR